MYLAQFATVLVGLVASGLTNAATVNWHVTASHALEKQFSSTDAADVTVMVPAGGFWALTIEEVGIDLRVIVDERQTLEGPVYRYGREQILYNVEDETRFQLSIVPTENRAPPGSVKISLVSIEENIPITAAVLKQVAKAATKAKSAKSSEREQSARHYMRAADILSDTKGAWLRELRADALFAAAETYYSLGENAKSLSAAERAADEYGNAQSWFSAGLVTNTISILHMDAIRYSEAKHAIDAAAKLIGRAENNEFIHYVEFNRCLLLMLENNLEKAQSCFDTVAAAAEAARDLYLVAAVAGTLPGIYHKRGEPTAAIEYLEKAQEAWSQLQDPMQEGLALNNLAVQHRRLGDTQKALRYYQAAMEKFKLAGRTYNRALSASNVSHAYLRLGDIARAESFATESLALMKGIDSEKGIMTAEANLAMSKHAAGEGDLAVTYLERSLQRSRKMGAYHNEVEILEQLGKVMLDLGEPVNAMRYLTMASTLIETKDVDVFRRAAVAHSLGRAELAQRKSTPAARHLDEAIQLRRKASYLPGLAESLLLRAQAALQSGEESAALEFAEEALATTSSVVRGIVNPDLRASSRALDADIFEVLVSIWMRRHSRDPDQGHDIRALELSEQSRAQTLVEMLADANMLPTSRASQGLQKRKHDLLKKLNFAASELLEGRRSNIQVDKISAELDAVDSGIYRSDDRYRELMNLQRLDIREIQKLLSDGDLLLQYFLAKQSSYVWAISSNSVISMTLAGRELIEGLARDLQERMRAIGNVRQSVASLSATIVGPLKTEIEASKQLIIIPHGALHYVPFEILSLSGQADTIIDRHAIAYLPSAKTLSIQRSQLRETDAAGIAIFSDPVFDSADRRLADTDNQKSTRSPFDRLPMTTRETTEIASLFLPDEVTIFSSTQANRKTFLDIGLQRYKILHLATHGIMNADRPELSGLALSMVDIEGNSANGFVGLKDIYDLRLNADLVVLSACDSGLGRKIRGEGMLGLTRGFVYAGAKRVVASLWQVQDRATAELMREFYRAMVLDEAKPVQALQLAKNRIRSQPRWRHPYFWSGFVIQGDWK